MKNRFNLLLGSLVVIAMTQAAHATALTWDTTIAADGTITAGSGTWTNGLGNWNTGSTSSGINWNNATPDSATFAGADGTYAITIGGAITAGSLTFNNSGYTLSATAAQTITSPTIAVALNKSATIGSNVTVSSASGAVMTINGPGTLNIASGATVKEGGTSNVLLSGGSTVNVQTGGLLTASTQFVIGDVNGGSQLNVAGSATLTNTGSGNIVLSNVGSGTGTGTSGLKITSGGVVTNSSTGGGLRFGNNSAGTFTNNGTVDLDGGTLTVAKIYEGTGGTTYSTFNFNGGTLKVLSGTTFASSFMTGLDNAYVKEGGAIIDTNGVFITVGQALVHGGVATTDGGLTKIGQGTLSLSGANSYTGATTISNGGLVFLNTGAKAASGTTTVAAGTTLGLGVATSGAFFTSANVDSLFAGTLANVTNDANSNVGIDTSAGDFTYATSVGSSTRGLVKYGANTLFLTGSNAYTGLTTVSTGVLNIQNATALGTVAQGTSVASGAALQLQGGITIGAEALTLNGTGISSDGALRNISGTNTYGGLVTLGGSARINSDQNTLVLSNTGTITGASSLTVGGAGNTSIASIIGMTNGTLTKDGAGTLTLSAANTLGGATTVSLGTLNLSSQNSLQNSTLTMTGGSLVFDQSVSGNAFTLGGLSAASGASNNIALQNNNGSPAAVALTVGSNMASTTYAAVLSGAGSLTKTGAGTLTLSGANSYTGGTNVNGGTLLWSGANNLPGTGTLAVNAGGTFSLADGTARATTSPALTLASGAALAFDWTGASALDSLTSSAAVATTAGDVIGISIKPSGTPSGSGTLITGAAGSSLDNATYYLANNANYTATLGKSATTVTIGSYASVASPAATLYWKGGVLTGALGAMAYSTGATSNWTSDAGGATAVGYVPGSSTLVNFSATGASQQSNITLGADMTVSGLIFNDSSAVTLGSGNALTLMSTSGTASSSAITVTSGANASNTINSNILLGASQTWNIATGKTLTAGGAIAGNFGLIKSDVGTLVLAGSVNTVNTSGSGELFRVTGGTSTSTSSTLTLSPAGSSIIGATSGSNNINIAPSEISSTVYDVAVFNQTAGTVNSTAINIAGLGVGTYALSGGTANTNSVNLGINGQYSPTASAFLNVSGSAALNIYSNGSMTLGTYYGHTATINQTGGTVAFYSDAGATLGGTGSLAFNGGSANSAYTLSGGTLAIPNITLRSSSGGAGGGSGTINLNGGTLKITNSAFTVPTVAGKTVAFKVQGDGTVANSGANIDTNGLAINFNAPLVHSGPNATDGGLTKIGAGTLTLSGGASTYTGPTTVQVGTLALGNATDTLLNTGAVKITGGTLDIGANSDTVGVVTLTSGSITGTTGVLTGSAYNVETGSISAKLAGNSGLTKSNSGTVTLTGALNTTNTAGSVIKVTGGTSGSNSILTLSPTSSSVAGANSNNNSVSIGDTYGDYAVFNQTAGTLNSTSVSIGNLGTGTYNLSGGISNTNSVTMSFTGPQSGTGETFLNVSGSSALNILSNGKLTLGTYYGRKSTIVQTGGNVSFYSDAGTTLGGTGGLAFNGGAGSYTLSGGTLAVPNITWLASGGGAGGGTGAINLNGGTLKITNASFTVPTQVSMNVQGNGAIANSGANIDTSGLSINFNAGLLHSGPNATDGGLTKTGAGTLTMSGTSTYTGPTTVSVGVLAVNGALANTTTTVGNAARLQGSGSIGGAVTVQNGGTIAAGNSIESLATGALNLNGGSTFAYEIDKSAAAGVAGDLTAVSGALTLDLANTALLTLSELGASGSWSTGKKLTLISYSGTWNGGLFNYGGTLADDSVINFSGTDWLFNYNDTTPGTNYTSDLTGSSFVTMTAVPEPGGILLVLLGASALVVRRRRSA